LRGDGEVADAGRDGGAEENGSNEFEENDSEKSAVRSRAGAGAGAVGVEAPPPQPRKERVRTNTERTKLSAEGTEALEELRMDCGNRECGATSPGFWEGSWGTTL
jgi:hypothetical protein